MKILLLICLCLFSAPSFGQCVSLKQMRIFFSMSLEQRDALMTSKGYSLRESSKDMVTWDQDYGAFSVGFDENGKTYETSLHTTVKPCYNFTKSQLVELGLKKDGEFSLKIGFVFFYSNPLYGVTITRYSDSSGPAYYEVSVKRKKEYFEYLQYVNDYSKK